MFPLAGDVFITENVETKRRRKRKQNRFFVHRVFFQLASVKGVCERSEASRFLLACLLLFTGLRKTSMPLEVHGGVLGVHGRHGCMYAEWHEERPRGTLDAWVG